MPVRKCTVNTSQMRVAFVMRRSRPELWGTFQDLTARSAMQREICYASVLFQFYFGQFIRFTQSYVNLRSDTSKRLSIQFNTTCEVRRKLQ